MSQKTVLVCAQEAGLSNESAYRSVAGPHNRGVEKSALFLSKYRIIRCCQWVVIERKSSFSFQLKIEKKFAIWSDSFPKKLSRARSGNDTVFSAFD